METYEEFKERLKKEYGKGIKGSQYFMLYERYKSDFEIKKNYIYINNGSELSQNIKPVEK